MPAAGVGNEKASAWCWGRDASLGWQVRPAVQVMAQPYQQFPEAPAPSVCAQAWELKGTVDGSGFLWGTLVPHAGRSPGMLMEHTLQGLPEAAKQCCTRGMLSNCAAPTPGSSAFTHGKAGGQP